MNNLEKLAKLKKKLVKLPKAFEKLENTLKIEVAGKKYAALFDEDCTPVKLRIAWVGAQEIQSCEFTITKTTLRLGESKNVTVKEQKQLFKAVSKWLTSPTQNRK